MYGCRVTFDRKEGISDSRVTFIVDNEWKACSVPQDLSFYSIIDPHLCNSSILLDFKETLGIVKNLHHYTQEMFNILLLSNKIK